MPGTVIVPRRSPTTRTCPNFTADVARPRARSPWRSTSRSRRGGTRPLAAAVVYQCHAYPPFMTDRCVLLLYRLVDGTGRPPLERAFVLIEDERIVAVGPAGRGDEGLSGAIRRHTYPGCTVVPGLVDSHV